MSIILILYEMHYSAGHILPKKHVGLMDWKLYLFKNNLYLILN